VPGPVREPTQAEPPERGRGGHESTASLQARQVAPGNVRRAGSPARRTGPTPRSHLHVGDFGRLAGGSSPGFPVRSCVDRGRRSRPPHHRPSGRAERDEERAGPSPTGLRTLVGRVGWRSGTEPYGSPDAPRGAERCPSGRPDAPRGAEGNPTEPPDAPRGAERCPSGRLDAPRGADGSSQGHPDAPRGAAGSLSRHPEAPRGAEGSL
jgi:hypothetical protein